MARDGILINADGTIVSVVYGLATRDGPDGLTFRECDTHGLRSGQPAPPAIAATIPPTDGVMARVCEDLVVSLLSKGVIVKTDLPDAAVAHVNDRRALRGLPAL